MGSGSRTPVLGCGGKGPTDTGGRPRHGGGSPKESEQPAHWSHRGVWCPLSLCTSLSPRARGGLYAQWHYDWGEPLPSSPEQVVGTGKGGYCGKGSRQVIVKQK